MRFRHRIRTALLVIALALVLPGLGLRIYMGSGAEDRLTPEDAINIADLRSPLPRTSFLACPAGYCAVPSAVVSPVFDMPWDRLREYWFEMISNERRLVRVAEFAPRRYVYIQHTPVFRFPDIVTVEFVPLGSDRSSIAVYSRSRYGRYDFAKNRKRVERWLLTLQKLTKPSSPSPIRAP